MFPIHSPRSREHGLENGGAWGMMDQVLPRVSLLAGPDSQSQDRNPSSILTPDPRPPERVDGRPSRLRRLIETALGPHSPPRCAGQGEAR